MGVSVGYRKDQHERAKARKEVLFTININPRYLSKESTRASWTITGSTPPGSKLDNALRRTFLEHAGVPVEKIEELLKSDV